MGAATVWEERGRGEVAAFGAGSYFGHPVGGDEYDPYKVLLTRDYPWASSSAIDRAADLMRAADDAAAAADPLVIDWDGIAEQADMIARIIGPPPEFD